MLICNVVGARPNFIKMAPVVLELKRLGFNQLLVHTGQHYDANMSEVFFTDLNMPRPDVHLEVGSGSHAKQTASVMSAFEEICLSRRPDLIIAAGDVNSTLAVALVAAKLLIPLAHVEAGLRSFDKTMPEEINRIVTDHVSDLLFATELSGVENLRREGIPDSQVHFVGNCMVDSLIKHQDAAIALSPWEQFGRKKNAYALLTLHRPSNVDNDETLLSLMDVLESVSAQIPVLFPAHPRTRARLARLRAKNAQGVQLIDPQPYITFLGLMAGAKCVLTDSGGIQEETTALRVPCITLRETTERPSTILEGSNRLVGTNRALLLAAVDDVSNNRWIVGKVPQLWDGHAASRLVAVLSDWCGGRNQRALDRN